MIFPVLAAAAALAAPVTVTSAEPEAVSVTIYRLNDASARDLYGRLGEGGADDGALGLVVETRTIRLAAGDNIVRFRGVSDRLIPETARVSGLPGPVGEQNFDYDLLSPGSLLKRSVGARVRLIRTDAKSGSEQERRAVIRSAPDGVVIESAEGAEAPGCGGPNERLVFDRTPDGLADQPTLSLRVHAPKAGRYTVRLAYLATGLNWSADYTARLRPDGKTLDLSGWITLANSGSTSFRKAPVAVVAGRLNVTGEDHAPDAEPVTRSDQCWPMAVRWGTPVPPRLAQQVYAMEGYGRGGVVVEDVVVTGSRVPQPNFTASAPISVIESRNLGDYKLYPLPWATTVAARQAKQVQFLSKQAVPFQRVYIYNLLPTYGGYALQDGDGEGPRSTILSFRLKNTLETGLGSALPAGQVSVTESSGGAPLLTGGGSFSDTPVGQPIDMGVSEVNDVRVSRRVVSATSDEDAKAGLARITIEATAANDRAEPVAFEFNEPPYGRDFRVVSETVESHVKDGHRVWPLALAPGESRTVRISVEWRPGE